MGIEDYCQLLILSDDEESLVVDPCSDAAKGGFLHDT